MPIADISARLPDLERMAREGANPSLIAKEVVQTWLRVEAVLQPIVGAKGVAALYGHSRQRAAEQYPWLNSGDGAQPDWKLMDLNLLQLQLADQGPGEALRASLVHLDKFERLLGTLIGEVLKNQLLAQAWPSPNQGAGEPRPLDAQRT